MGKWCYRWMKSIHDERYRQLIQQLIAVRTDNEITQSVLSARLSKPQSYVAKVENLERRLDVVELADWLQALEVEPKAFIAALTWF